MGFYTVRTGSGKEGNPQSGSETVNAAATATITFLSPCNCALLQTDVDTTLTLEWGATPETAGSAATPKTQATRLVGPSHGPAFLWTDRGYATLGVRNVGSSNAAVVFNVWSGHTS